MSIQAPATAPAPPTAIEPTPIAINAVRMRPTADGSVRKLSTNQPATTSITPNTRSVLAQALEVAHDLAGHVRPDALHASEVLLRGRAKVVDRSEVGGQQLRGRLAHLRDAQRVQESRQLGPPACGDAVDQVLRRLVGKTL